MFIASLFIFHNSQKVEATQMSINMNDQQNITYTHWNIILTKVGNSDTCYDMDEF